MKHSIFNKTFSVTLAILVMMSTLSFTIEKHFCGNNLVDVAWLSETEGCGMEISASTENSCCKEEIDVIEGQDELKYSKYELDQQDQEFITVFVIAYIDLFEGLPEQVIPFKEYSPPNLFYDRQVLHEVFII